MPGVKQYLAALIAEHERRIASDPDFVHLVNTLELSNSWDADKAVSLNIEQRRARSRDWDKQRFLLENKRRKSKGLELYADQKAWKSDNKVAEEEDDESLAEGDDKTNAEDKIESIIDKPPTTESLIDSENDSLADGETATAEDDKEEEDIAETDPILQEAGHILADQIRLQTEPAGKHMLVNSEKVEK